MKLLKKIRQLVDDIRWDEAASARWWVTLARRQVRLYIYIARETVQDRCLRQAAALTFTTLLSLVPLFAVAFSVFRGFEAFEGLEQRAQRAIFETMLAAPLMGGGAERTDWNVASDEMPDLPPEEVTAEEILAQAEDLPRQSKARQAARLYLEALRRGADPAEVRNALSTLYFGSPASTRRLVGSISEDLEREYANAARVPDTSPKAQPWKGYQHYSEALSLQDHLNYEAALEQLRKAEAEGFLRIKTRMALAEIRRIQAQKHRKEGRHREASTLYQTAARLTTDALFLSRPTAQNKVLRRVIDEHNGLLRELGEVFLALGHQKFDLYQKLKEKTSEDPSETIEEAIDILRKASRQLEHTPEAHATLADALWAKGDVEEARRQYKLAAESSRTGAARGFSLAVADYIRRLVDRASSAGLGILGVIVLIGAATSLFSTVEKTLNGIWQVSQKRPLWIKFTAFCTLIWLGPAMIAVSILVREKLGQQAAATFIGIPGLETLFRFIAAMGNYVLPLVTVWLVLLAIYKFIPHTTVHFGPAAWGAFVGAVLVQIARPGFGLYVNNAIKYEKIYGSLGAIPIFLLWLWLLWVLVLFGAEVAFTVQNIGLLRFRERLHRLSGLFIDRYLAARIMMYVAREFWRNSQPMTVEKLAEILQMPPEEAANSAHRLVKLGLLTPVGEEQDQFHPARDLSQLTLMDVLSITDRFRWDSRSRRDEDSVWENKLEEVFDSAIEAQEEALRDMTFRDLMAECEAAEQKTAEQDGEQKTSAN
jgi:YihY family inner membrane protein